MKNMFENSKFGDVFFTRGGDIAIFEKKDDKFAYMHYQGLEKKVAVDVNTGRWLRDKETHADIVRNFVI